MNPTNPLPQALKHPILKRKCGQRIDAHGYKRSKNTHFPCVYFFIFKKWFWHSLVTRAIKPLATINSMPNSIVGEGQQAILALCHPRFSKSLPNPSDTYYIVSIPIPALLSLTNWVRVGSDLSHSDILCNFFPILALFDCLWDEKYYPTFLQRLGCGVLCPSCMGSNNYGTVIMFMGI